MFANSLTHKLADFVRGLGIDVRPAELPGGTFLPGLDIRDGGILVDEARLNYPGDLLHEAGHLAVTDPAERNAPSLDPTPGDEMAALAWSYAALRHLEIAPEIVFHRHGYKGGGEALIRAFETPGGPGVPLLQWYGMTLDSQHAADGGVEPFPHMLRWVR
ncbi:MAG: hypothetical protein QOD74_786 [Variibacter sp.]|nr:hypothetical protein [Variibacter sp.]